MCVRVLACVPVGVGACVCDGVNYEERENTSHNPDKDSERGREKEEGEGGERNGYMSVDFRLVKSAPYTKLGFSKSFPFRVSQSPDSNRPYHAKAVA